MIVNQTYSEFLAQELPAVIETEQDHDRLLRIAEKFMRESMDRELSSHERRAFDLVSVLIRDYEDRTYDIPHKSPLEKLNFMMEQRGTNPVDLAPIFGSRGYVSDVLSGRRNISIEKGKALAKYFGLNENTFIDLSGGVRVRGKRSLTERNKAKTQGPVRKATKRRVKA